MCAGFAADDGVALHFKGTRLDSVVSSRERGGAFHVQRVGDEVMETALEVTYLGERSGPAKRGGGTSSGTADRRSKASTIGQQRGLAATRAVALA
jgi:hypothetical protein